MSDYSQTTDFSAKDALSAGDPSKAVKGTELDVELEAISVAILSKYDSADLATQAEAEAGTNNTKLMTPLRTAQWHDDLDAGTTKYKSATETVNNSSTLQDDDHIASFSLEASTAYHVHGILHCSIRAASDIKLALTCSSAPTALNVGFVGVSPSTITRNIQVASGTAVALTTGSNEEMLIFVDGIIRANAACTLKLQWAQNSAQSENTTLGIGSHVTITKIS